LLASNMAGMANNSALLGIVHAMAHPCSGHFGVAHGLANAVLLPFGMQFNLPEVTARMAQVGEALGLDLRQASAKQAAQAAIDAVRCLALDLALPSRLSQLGVPHEALPRLAEDAMGDAMLYTNPRQPTQDEVLALYQLAY
jgi:alcohol dehydrogenase class IV